MDIFESLENLNVSEECFEDIVGLVEAIINEGIHQDIDKKYGKTEDEKTDDALRNVINQNLSNIANIKSMERHAKKIGKYNPGWTYRNKIESGNPDYSDDKAVELKKREELKDKAKELEEKGYHGYHPNRSVMQDNYYPQSASQRRASTLHQRADRFKRESVDKIKGKSHNYAVNKQELKEQPKAQFKNEIQRKAQINRGRKSGELQKFIDHYTKYQPSGYYED